MENLKIGQFVRLLGKHERSGECGKVKEINGETAVFEFYSDGVLTVQPLKNLSSDTLIYHSL